MRETWPQFSRTRSFQWIKTNLSNKRSITNKINTLFGFATPRLRNYSLRIETNKLNKSEILTKNEEIERKNKR